VRYVFERLLGGIVVLWVVATLTFFMMHIVPGGPFDRDRVLPPEIMTNIAAKYRLDEPVTRQYAEYLGGILRGDFGPSYKYQGRTVADILHDAFPVSIQLGVSALLLAILAGGVGGIVSGAAASRPVDHAALVIASIGISVPTFVLGSLLVLVFSQTLHYLPPALWEGWRSIILPSVALACAPAAYIARLLRSSLIETLEMDYVRTAKAKGIRPALIILKHALRGSLTPVVSYLGPLTAALITGSFVIEYLFSIPGMGRFFVTAVTNRDYPLIMGTTLVYATVIVAANAIVDMVYAAIDPRVGES
jgi:oligopeptide transport system permease protein